MNTSTEMNENILDNLCTALILLDHELRVCFINQAAENLLETSANQILGAPIVDLVSGLDSVVSVFYDAIQSGQPYAQRLAELGLLNGNTITVNFTITPISEGEWPRLLVELHALDRYLRIDRDAASHEHQEITRQMMRGLAHEVKNPLGGIRGSAQLLEKALSSDEQKEYTKIIIEETDRLTNLVDQMLGPRSLPALNPTNIHELLERIITLIKLENPEVHLTRDYDPSIPELMIDAEMIFQALLNIARNAVQSMAEVKSPAFSMTTRTERQFTINSTRNRTVLRIDVADNGCGIPPDIEQQLFYPMISGRPGGTGLGLPMVHSIIYQHQGIIEFESKPGATVFSIFLPLEQQ